MQATFGQQLLSQAIEQYAAALADGAGFSAVVMDLTIPGGMGGKEAAEQILALDSPARLIVSSGYSNDPIMADFASYGFAAAIAKPYTIKNFEQVLGEVLASGRNTRPTQPVTRPATAACSVPVA